MGGKTQEQHPVPLNFATTAYKKWVKERLDEAGWSYDLFAEKIVRAADDDRITATSASVSQFFFPDDKAPFSPTNTKWMPAINKIFGKPPPLIYDPEDRVVQIATQVSEKMTTMSPTERAMLDALFPGILEKKP